MEPRSAERGNARAACQQDEIDARFNGATLSRTWKRERKVSILDNGRCFNGATLSRTWKPATKLQSLAESFLLQWSHAQPNVETHHLQLGGRARQGASMEPRSAERGNQGNILP